MILTFVRLTFGAAATSLVGWLGWRIGVFWFNWPPFSFGACVLALCLIWLAVLGYDAAGGRAES
jgi:hypothetical protein